MTENTHAPKESSITAEELRSLAAVYPPSVAGPYLRAAAEIERLLTALSEADQQIKLRGEMMESQAGVNNDLHDRIDRLERELAESHAYAGQLRDALQRIKGRVSWRRACSEIGCGDELATAFLGHKMGDPRSIDGTDCVCPRIVSCCNAQGCPRSAKQLHNQGNGK